MAGKTTWRGKAGDAGKETNHSLCLLFRIPGPSITRDDDDNLGEVWVGNKDMSQDDRQALTDQLYDALNKMNDKFYDRQQENEAAQDLDLGDDR